LLEHSVPAECLSLAGREFRLFFLRSARRGRRCPRPRPPFPHHTSNRRTMNALMRAGSTRVPLPETASKGRPPHRKPPLSSRVSTTNESDGAAMDELPPRLCPAPKSATPRWATPERCNNGFAIVYRPWDGVNGLSNGCQRFDLDAIDLGDALTSFSATTVAGTEMKAASATERRFAHWTTDIATTGRRSVLIF
jgi:hypothetical protein